MPTRRAFSALAPAAFGALAIAALPLRHAAANPDASLGALLARYVIEPPDGVTRVRYAALKASAEDMRALDAWIPRPQRAALPAWRGLKPLPIGPISIMR